MSLALMPRLALVSLVALLLIGCLPDAAPGPRLGEMQNDERGRRSMLFGAGSVAGLEWSALASVDDMFLVDPFVDPTGWVCTFTVLPGHRLEEIAHVCLPPLEEGEVIGRTTLRGVDGVQFLHGIADVRVERIRMDLAGQASETLVVPLVELGLPGRLFAFAYGLPAGDASLVAIDAQGHELGILKMTPPPALPNGPPPPP